MVVRNNAFSNQIVFRIVFKNALDISRNKKTGTKTRIQSTYRQLHASVARNQSAYNQRVDSNYRDGVHFAADATRAEGLELSRIELLTIKLVPEFLLLPAIAGHSIQSIRGFAIIVGISTAVTAPLDLRRAPIDLRIIRPHLSV